MHFLICIFFRMQIKDQLWFLLYFYFLMVWWLLLMRDYWRKRWNLTILLVLNFKLFNLRCFRLLDKLFLTSVFSVLFTINSQSTLILTLSEKLLLMLELRSLYFVLLSNAVEEIRHHFGRCSYFHKFLFSIEIHVYSK